MFNLLPQNEKQNILKEYMTRRYILIAIFLFALGVIAVVALMPSYLLSEAKINEIKVDLVEIRKSAAFKEADALNKTLVDTNAKLASLKEANNAVYISDVIEKTISKRDLNIRINGIMYERKEKGEMGSITITGVAHNREHLSKFVEGLKAEKLFTSVDLPVSNFAKDRNADFSIQIKGAF